MAKDIFRKSAIQRLSSLDQLDHTMKVLKPSGWIAVLSIAVIIGAAITWGFIGSIPTTINGTGIIVDTSELTTVKYSNSGIIKDLFIKIGDHVKKDQVIARVERKDLLDDINATKNKLANLQEIYEKTKKFSERSMSSAARIEQMRQLYVEGLITENEYKSYNTGEANSKQAVMNVQNQINETKFQLESKIRNYQDSTKIFSSQAGYVYEIPVSMGDFISQGSTIAVIGPDVFDKSCYSAKLYYTANDGKKIKRGMKIDIVPSTIKQEEYGYIQGIVVSVSEYPVSPEFIQASLQNRSLAQSLSQQIANPMEVRVSLIPDSRNYSGLKWSSSKGPESLITAGIVCQGNITVKKQKPIELVVPLFKRKIIGIGD